MRKHCKNFMDWALSQNNEFYAIVDKGKYLGVSVYSTSSSIVANITNDRTGRSGHASVKADKFDDPTIIVIGLAWANYKGEKIPEFRKTRFLSGLANGVDFQTKDGKSYTKIGVNCYNQRDKMVVCLTHAMTPEYIEMGMDDIVYLP